MNIRTSVTPDGHFNFSIHKPAFTAKNLREKEFVTVLGQLKNGIEVNNQQNFPVEDIVEENADWIFEIPNPFPFRGTTYIGKRWADRAAKAPESIALPEPDPTSFTDALTECMSTEDASSTALSQIEALFDCMPSSVRLALAVTSTDPEDLIRLARLSAEFIYTPDGSPKGMAFFQKPDGTMKPIISDEKLFDAVANNPHLPDRYKKVMVLVPGIQGTSEIVGEWVSETKNSHVFEYLRRNSYIPWGHYAANMAHDAVRYHSRDLLPEDICGMRHLYYQRTYVRVAEQIQIAIPFQQRSGTAEELELLRGKVLERLNADEKLQALVFDRTLWGWNFGFDFAASGYRLHASHQQVHQQYAMVPASVSTASSDAYGHNGDLMEAYACGDLIADFIEAYRQRHGVAFFSAYEKAIRSNQRMDGEINGPRELIVYEDDNVLLFVPKAQTSQWELQLMPKTSAANVLEAHRKMRNSLDRGIWIAMRTLGAMGAKMITVFEFSGKIRPAASDQRLLYTFLPRLPESPGAFSEAQLRWINGHYPEDFAAACRKNMPPTG